MSVIFLEPQPISNAMNSIALIGPPCPTPQPRHLSSRLGRLVAVSCWIYLVILLGLWLGLSWGDTWWPATLIMFTPRLVLALPVVVLFPAALLLRRRPSRAGHRLFPPCGPPHGLLHSLAQCHGPSSTRRALPCADVQHALREARLGPGRSACHHHSAGFRGPAGMERIKEVRFAHGPRLALPLEPEAVPGQSLSHRADYGTGT